MYPDVARAMHSMLWQDRFSLNSKSCRKLPWHCRQWGHHRRQWQQQWQQRHRIRSGFTCLLSCSHDSLPYTRRMPSGCLETGTLLKWYNVHLQDAGPQHHVRALWEGLAGRLEDDHAGNGNGNGNNNAIITIQNDPTFLTCPPCKCLLHSCRDAGRAALIVADL